MGLFSSLALALPVCPLHARARPARERLNTRQSTAATRGNSEEPSGLSGRLRYIVVVSREIIERSQKVVETMGATHAHGPDWRWVCAAATLGAKAAHARGRGDFPGFGWMFGGGPGPWGPPGGFTSGPPWARGRHGGPWGRGPKARKGNVRAAILVLLAEEPRNGYQIIQEIHERSDGAWKPSPGAVYPALQQLADEELIAGEE